MNESLIFVNLMGGLGNQLFQYAAGLLHRKTSNGVLILCKPHTNIHDSRDYREIIFKNENKYDGGLLPQATLYQDDGYAFWNPREWDFSMILLYGYFQNYEVLKPILPEFKMTIMKNLEEYKMSMRQKYLVTDSSIFIHIRRGDFLKLQDIFPLQSVDYYKKAYTSLSSTRLISKIFLFSDDLEWCRSEEFFKSLNPTYVDEDVIESLALMSEIRGGAIIANSTLSWMGAYLGCELKNVYYPKKWLTDNNKTVSICPNEWIGVEC